MIENMCAPFFFKRIFQGDRQTGEVPRNDAVFDFRIEETLPVLALRDFQTGIIHKNHGIMIFTDLKLPNDISEKNLFLLIGKASPDRGRRMKQGGVFPIFPQIFDFQGFVCYFLRESDFFFPAFSIGIFSVSNSMKFSERVSFMDFNILSIL